MRVHIGKYAKYTFRFYIGYSQWLYSIIMYSDNVIINLYIMYINIYMDGLFKKSLWCIFHDDRVATVGTRRDNIHRSSSQCN